MKKVFSLIILFVVGCTASETTYSPTPYPSEDEVEKMEISESQYDNLASIPAYCSLGVYSENTKNLLERAMSDGKITRQEYRDIDYSIDKDLINARKRRVEKLKEELKSKLQN